ncbi:MAG: DUF2059 domain-containing protein [Acidobacteria bacterium]|nr:DUF2059 domain-containing protein [Acidobacteriota bacterium]
MLIFRKVISAALLATALVTPLWGAQTAAKPPTNSPSQAEAPPIDPAKLADLQRLLEVSGSKKNVHEMTGAMLNSLRPQLERGMPPGERSQQVVTAVLRKLTSVIDSDEFFLHLAQIYDNFFTQEDVRELIKFYESPAGKHFAAVMPQMTQQFVNVTQQWLAERVPKMMEELSQEYPELKPGSPRPPAPERPSGQSL